MSKIKQFFDLKERTLKLEYISQILLVGMIIVLFIVSIINVILILITEGAFSEFSLFMMVFCFGSGLLLKKRYNMASANVLLFGLNVIIIYRGYSIYSAYMFTFLSIFLVISAIISKPKYTHLLFLMDIIAIIIAVVNDRFTVGQPEDPDTGVYYANTITDLIPNIIVAYAVSLVIRYIFYEVFQKQQAQYLELEKTQQKLLTQEKLSSLKSLAGGIAHDFNNLLTSIVGALSLVNSLDEITEDEKELLVDAEKASLRAKGLTQELLNFAKETSPHLDLISNVEELVKEVAFFTARGTSIKPQIRLEGTLDSINADQGQISQLIQNLVLNAIQAIPSDGQIIISLKNITIPPENDLSLKKGPYIFISVKDTGKGIPKSIISSLFEPFITTKQNGTGLGLSISKTIAERHEGLLKLHDTGKKGTEFHIYLPSLGKFVQEGHTKVEFERKYSGKVLIMDDDKKILKTLTKMLMTLGLTVEACEKGEEVIELVSKAHNDPNLDYLLVILDYTIPGKYNGLDIYEKIRKINKNLKVIISSGHLMGRKIELIEDPQLKFLGKPYTLQNLSEIMQKFTI